MIVLAGCAVYVLLLLAAIFLCRAGGLADRLADALLADRLAQQRYYASCDAMGGYARAFEPARRVPQENEAA